MDMLINRKQEQMILRNGKSQDHQSYRPCCLVLIKRVELIDGIVCFIIARVELIVGIVDFMVASCSFIDYSFDSFDDAFKKSHY